MEDLLAHPDLPEVEETGTTFAENAALKAVAGSRHFPDGWVIADDSGLEVDALGGAPGVYSARYAGPGADDEANRQKLVRELRAVLVRGLRAGCRRRGSAAASPWRGAARWRSSFDGAVEGMVIPAARGEGGFGYDPMFIPAGYQETFAELPAEVKNRLSHRRRRCGRWRIFSDRTAKSDYTPLGGVCHFSPVGASTRPWSCERRATCLVPGFADAISTPAWKDALWGKFSTRAPEVARVS